jgi:hypothetical protein
MSEELDPVVQIAERLCATLDRIGDALVTIDTAALLDTEGTLEQLLAALATGHAVRDRAALEALVGRAAQALVRCRALGASFAGIAGARSRLRTGVEAYGRDGAYVEPEFSGSTVKVMT